MIVSLKLDLSIRLKQEVNICDLMSGIDCHYFSVYV